MRETASLPLHNNLARGLEIYRTISHGCFDSAWIGILPEFF